MPRHIRHNDLASNPIVKAWKFFGCEMDSQTFDSIFKSYVARFELWRLKRQIYKTLTPEQRKYLDSLE